MYDIIVVNKLYPHQIILKPSYKQMKNFIKQKRKLLIRLFILFVSSLMLMISRFSIMGFKAPSFQPVDNPASFMNITSLRMLNYTYIYCLNIWLLICPEWLCFDWSMGCIPLIINSNDKRILFVLLFWLVLGAMFIYIFNSYQDNFLRYLYYIFMYEIVK